MKYLILLLLSFNLQAQVVSGTVDEDIVSGTVDEPIVLCSLNSPEEVAACTPDELAALEAEVAAIEAARLAAIAFKNSVNGMDRFRRRANSCGYGQPNMALLRLKIIKDNDIIKRDCLLGKVTELDTEDSDKASKELVRKNLKENMKSANCSTLVGTVKLMCRVLKEM